MGEGEWRCLGEVCQTEHALTDGQKGSGRERVGWCGMGRHVVTHRWADMQWTSVSIPWMWSKANAGVPTGKTLRENHIGLKKNI